MAALQVQTAACSEELPCTFHELRHYLANSLLTSEIATTARAVETFVFIYLEPMGLMVAVPPIQNSTKPTSAAKQINYYHVDYLAIAKPR